MKHLTVQYLFYTILAISFTLSYAQIRIVSTSHSFQGTNIASPVLSSRTATWTLDWKNTDRKLTADTAFIGISGIDVSSSIVDFSIGFDTTSDTEITMQIKVGSKCAINLIQHFVLSSFDYRVNLIQNVDFDADADFSIILGSGSTDAELNYTISYTPPRGLYSEYSTGTTAYVSFTAVKLDYTSTNYHFDYEVMQVTSSQVVIKIRKFGDTRLLALKGQVLIVSKTAKDEIGFSSTRIIEGFSPASGQTAMMLTEEVSTRTDYTGRPESIFFLSGYIFDNNYVAIATAGELGVSASDTITITMLSNQINSAQIRAVQYDVLLFCENEDDCITSQNPIVITGTTQLTSFLGTELSDASLSYDRILSFDVAFKWFFSSVPQYPCLGLQGGNADASFSISITGVTKKSVTITVQAFANQAITGITITYVASNWNGFQCSLVDLTPYLPSPSAPASDWMIIPFSASYTPTPEFTGNVICRVALVEINMPLSQSISFGSSEVSGTTTDTSISCALNMDQDSFTSLKGYVFLYPDPNNVNSMYGLATMDIPAATLTDNNYYSVSGSLTNGQIDYSQSPYIFTFISTLANCGTLALETTQTINYYARDSSGPTCDFKWTFSIRDTYCSTNPKYVYTSVSFLRNNSHTVVYPTDSTAFEIVQGQDYVCMVADFTSPNEYALVIADESSYNGTIRFIQNIGKVARIVQTSILVPSGSGIVRQATFSPITISSSSKLTYHLIRVQSAGTWALGGTFDYFTSFAFSFSELEFSVGNFGYNGADLTKAKDAYGTVYATRVYMHDKGLDFECQAQITFSGLIRGMYLDGQLVLAGSSPDPDTSVTITSEINAKFEGNTANAGFVTVIGTNLVITSLDFVNCVDGSNTPLTPTPIWTDYAPYDLLATSNTFYFPATDQAYPSGCSTFKDASTCYVCESDKQLFQGTCVSMCTDTTSFVPVRDLYCATNSENFGVKRTSTIYADSAKTITIDYKINPYVSLDAAVTIFYPFAVSKTNYPGVISTMPNTPSLAASTLYLKRISSRRMRMLQTSNPVFESFDMTGTFSISSVATAGYLQVQIVTLGLVQDIYLFIIKDPVRQEIALSKTYMPISSPVNTVTTTDIFEIQVVIDCASCNLVIDYVGQVAITLNQRTAIYSNTFTTRASYQLHRTLSGTSYLTIDCTQSTYFSFSIVGSYVAYGPNSLLFRDNVNLLAVASPCSIANCHNCFEDKCLSCADSYFLTQDGTECVTSCPNWPGERLCKDIEKDSRLIEAARVIDRIRKISNEFLSEISALGLKGLHSIRSQCLQSTLGYFIFLNVDYPTNYLEFAYDNYGGLNLPNPWGNAHVHKPMRRRSGARMLESDVPMEIDEVSSLNEYSEDHRIVANIGYILVVLFASILLVISVEALYEGVRKTEGYDSKWYFKTVKKSSLSLRWSYLLNELISRYQDLTFFSMLGIYDAGKDEIETENGNTALAVIGFLIIVGELALLFFLVRRVFNHVQTTTKKGDKESAKDEPKMDEYLKRRTILHEELAKDHLMQMLYPFFLVLRIFGFSFTVVFIPGVTAIQLVFLDLSSILMVVYLIKFKPFEEKAQLHMTLAYEIDFLVAAFAVTFIQITSHAENSDIAASFGVLLILATVSMTFLNILSFYLDIKEKVPEMIQQLKALKKASSKRKVAPSPPRLSVESPSQLMQLAKNSSEKTPNSGSPHERVFLVTAQDFDPNNSFSDIATDKVPSGKGVESSWRVRPTSKGVTQERLSIIDGTGLIGLRSRNFQRPSMISPTNLEIKNPLIDIESIDQISSPKMTPSEADSPIKMV